MEEATSFRLEQKMDAKYYVVRAWLGKDSVQSVNCTRFSLCFKQVEAEDCNECSSVKCNASWTTIANKSYQEINPKTNQGYTQDLKTRNMECFPHQIEVFRTTITTASHGMPCHTLFIVF